jgi:cyclomaltodextrinase
LRRPGSFEPEPSASTPEPSAPPPEPTSGPDWVRDAVFYQIFVDRFAASDRVPKPGSLEAWDAPPTTNGFKGGDLLGIAERLDYLAGLGITALYLTPVFASASNHRYHTYDYETVDPLLGRGRALRELLDESHRRGVRVILDGVFNHASRGFWPFNHVLENGAASPYRDWFYLDPKVQAGRRGVVAYPGRRELDALARHIEQGRPGSASEHVLGYQAWWDLPALPKLNHSNPAVREYLYGIAERWIDFGIDGWRLDVPQEIGEPGFWEEFRRRVLAANPEAYLVGELWNAAPEWLAGDRFHAAMNYPLAEATLSFAAAPTLDRELVARVPEYAPRVRPIDGPEFGGWLEAIMSTYDPATTQLQLNLLGSHDTPRFLSLAGGDRPALRLAALIQMTLPGAPCIYYGDEIGLEGGEDPDCRRAFPWDPARQDAGLRSFVAGLIELRRAEPALRRGSFRVVGSEGSAVAYALEWDEAWIVVGVNAGVEPARLHLPVPQLAGFRAERLSWSGSEWNTPFASTVLSDATLELPLAARAGAVLRVSPVR